MLCNIKQVKYKSVIIRAPTLVPRRTYRPLVRVKSNILLDSTQIIGDGIIYFTIIYCSLNWWYYKNLNSKDD